MFKIIASILLAASLPVLAQTAPPSTKTTAKTANDNDGGTTVTTTVTTDPVVVPSQTTTLQLAEPLEDRTAEGIVSEVNLGIHRLMVIVPDSSIPMKFSFNDQTNMADLNGATADWSGVKLGQAVTVTYFEGPAGDLVAKEIAFGDPAKLVPVPTQPATAVSTTTAIIATTPAPVVTEKVTTTTTTSDEEME